MSRPIQSLAPGFLSLLGLKNEGTLPPEFIDQLQPVIDLTRFYFLGGRETLPLPALVNVRAIANYVFVELTVPANEVWWVHGYVVDVAVPAAQGWVGKATHYSRNTIPIHSAASSGQNPLATNASDPRSAISDFFAVGGDLFGVVTEDSTGAGAENAVGQLTISRFLA